MTYSIAGKTFILGEYAVLSGLPAIVAATPPRFTLSTGSQGDEFHPLSPIGRLITWASQKKFSPLHFQFHDPLSGAGGFGASTAQFAMALRAYSQNQSLAELGTAPLTAIDAWKIYRELMKNEKPIPSGADLVAQWQGGVICFKPERVSIDLWNSFPWNQFLIFSATQQKDRKVATHHHLPKLTETSLLQVGGELYTELKDLIDLGLKSIQNRDPIRLGQVLNSYAEALCQVNLEIPATTADRAALQALPGVLGVKGAGALQADAILILIDPSADRETLIQKAQGRGLHLLCNGLTYEPGIS